MIFWTDKKLKARARTLSRCTSLSVYPISHDSRFGSLKKKSTIMTHQALQNSEFYYGNHRVVHSEVRLSELLIIIISSDASFISFPACTHTYRESNCGNGYWRIIEFNFGSKAWASLSPSRLFISGHQEQPGEHSSTVGTIAFFFNSLLLCWFYVVLFIVFFFFRLPSFFRKICELERLDETINYNQLTDPSWMGRVAEAMWASN